MLRSSVGEQSAWYDLFAMIVHRGLVVQNGHYVAYINLSKSNAGALWYLFDDESVVPVSDADFQKALRQSYMTFWIHRNRDAHDAIGF
jgi:ubiquitin C-terminal hydrolase